MSATLPAPTKQIVGIIPELPQFLAGWTSLTEPIRSERLAAFRIGLGLVLTLDILTSYLPFLHTFFGENSLGDPAVFASRLHGEGMRWSLFAGEGNFQTLQIGVWIWLASALCLMLGIMPRFAAMACLVLSISFQNLNYYIHNSGDSVRMIGLFYLMLSPCGAAWSLWNTTRKESNQPVYVSAWPVRLILLQLMAIYFVNGLYKFQGESWRDGSLMHQVLTNIAWTRVPYSFWPYPNLMVPPMTWLVLYWELGFPLLIVLPKTWRWTLALGACFHIGTGIMLQIGMFPLYMLCMYLPLLPWEKLADRFSPPRA